MSVWPCGCHEQRTEPALNSRSGPSSIKAAFLVLLKKSSHDLLILLCSSGDVTQLVGAAWGVLVICCLVPDLMPCSGGPPGTGSKDPQEEMKEQMC